MLCRGGVSDSVHRHCVVQHSVLLRGMPYQVSLRSRLRCLLLNRSWLDSVFGLMFSKQIPYTIPRSAFAEAVFPLSLGTSLSEMSTSAVQTASPWSGAETGVAAGTKSQLASVF